MSTVYDNWEKLVGAVLKREEFRRLALCESFSSSISADLSSRFGFAASLEDVPAASRVSKETFDLAGSSSRSNFFYRDAQPIAFEEIKKLVRKHRPVKQGGIGIVLRGWIDEHTLTASEHGSGMAVAVKWDYGGLQGHQKWLKKIKYLSQFHHPNLVKLIAYCLEQEHMISVHEFMPKGSLDNHLFAGSYQLLPWATRIKVAVGAARGLSFLHDLEIPVVHRDFTATNILLDGEFNPKLSNFTLATDGPTADMNDAPTQVVDPNGYAAPEYIMTGHLTTKCNVYSFGVLLLELLCGRRAVDKNQPKGKRYLVNWAKSYLGDKLEGQHPHNGACTVGKLALQCLSLDPKLRPRMADVVVAPEQL